MSFRGFIKQTKLSLREKFFGEVELQKLLDSKEVTIHKTKRVESEDENRLSTDAPWGPPGKVMCWSYRVKFDSLARKRNFMQAIEDYPEQFWDSWVRWYDDISNYEGEVCVEAMCRVPFDQYGKFIKKFEDTLSHDIIIAK